MHNTDKLEGTCICIARVISVALRLPKATKQIRPTVKCHPDQARKTARIGSRAGRRVQSRLGQLCVATGRAIPLTGMCHADKVDAMYERMLLGIVSNGCKYGGWGHSVEEEDVWLGLGVQCKVGLASAL
ncbi:unnamed protein product [Brugia pahangi]|uniref:Uncharacterized protein n=1 Tax=Brugia pahangi TaxID=6280 RepID=A0A0N4TU55_BRUPA|nr:unnamed protein product [Brugia pahangi]